MKKLLLFLTLLLHCFIGFAQKYDYRWVMGLGVPSGFPNFDVLFTLNSADTILTHRGPEMDNSQTTISDSAGNLLFYSNGTKIYDRRDSLMLYGDSINYGWEWEDAQGTSYPLLEDMIGLPTTNPLIWNLFHNYLNYDTNLGLYPWRIYETQIDMSKNQGYGEVTFKNKIIVEDTLGYYVTACQHANGRDWWILASKTSSNCLYTVLMQPDTVVNIGTQCIGAIYQSGDGGQAAFSPDGSKFAWVGLVSGVNLYDFDRCSGALSNSIFLPFYWTPHANYQFGLAFSPNSRFLYIAQTIYLLQFDTWAVDVAASIDTVGYYQPPPDSTSFPGSYFLMQLAPDGKIYVSANNGIKWLHVINQPDLKGDSCNFVNYGFPLPTYNSFGLPSYPGNYRLGAMPGSPCDTLSTVTEEVRAAKEKVLKVFPNPANDFTIIDYGFTDWSKGKVDLQISNELGQSVYEQNLPMYSGYQKIDVSKFAAGIYNVAIVRNNGVVGAAKLVKE